MRFCRGVLFLSIFLSFHFAQADTFYQIKIENVKGGGVLISRDQGTSWQLIGNVLIPTENVKEEGFAASIWTEGSKVAATAVNAIHIKVGTNESSRAIFSILPKEFYSPPKNYHSFLNPSSSIQTDIPAGTQIFGGDYSPFVGNQVLVSCEGYAPAPISEDFIPQIGDTFYILIEWPHEPPKEIVFENRFGGLISIEYFSGEKKVIGEVLRPVSGIGRFEGSLYVCPGRIRANHAGVIEISVSPIGSYGGFQIVPAKHSMDMGYVRNSAQYMVIGPANTGDPSLEGTAPFYKYFLKPCYSEKLLDRYLVQVKYAGQDKWSPMPIFSLRNDYALPNYANSALDKVGQIRILFPVTK